MGDNFIGTVSDEGKRSRSNSGSGASLMKAFRRKSGKKERSKDSPRESPREYELSPLHQQHGEQQHDTSADESISLAASRVHAAVDNAATGSKRSGDSKSSKKKNKSFYGGSGKNRNQRRSLLVTYSQLEYLAQSQHQQYKQHNNPLMPEQTISAMGTIITTGNSNTTDASSTTANVTVSGTGHDIEMRCVRLEAEVGRLHSKLDHLATHIINVDNTAKRVELKIDTYDDANGTDCRCCGLF